jgi:hypothetical protein
MVSTIDLSQSLLGLYRNGQTHPVAWESGPPPRIDGYVIGTPVMARPAPHNGEMHPPLFQKANRSLPESAAS